MEVQKNFFDCFDAMFLVCEDMIKENGEDSFYCAYCADAAVVSVFDGCGGLGARIHPEFRNHSAAYIASRLASGAVHDWFHDTSAHEWKNEEEVSFSLKDYFSRAYSIGCAYAQNNSKIRGSMVRDFPTTGAIALAQNSRAGLTLYFAWAGDSRVYLLDQDGLAQLSRDDLDGEDAFSNLTDDGALTNLLSSDGNYTIHCRKISLIKPAIIFSATDGCFGYFPSPMEFEYAVLKQLLAADSLTMFQQEIRRAFLETAGDDFTIGLMCFNYGTFQEMKHSFFQREARLKKLLAPLHNSQDDKDRLALWQKYRLNYERYF